MFDLLPVISVISGIVIFIGSLFHYKSFLNPMGVFAIIWGSLPYVYSLGLMPILDPLSNETSLALFGSFVSFIIGAFIVTQKKYKRLDQINFELTENEHKKAYRLYWFMFILAIGEMFVKTPTLLTENPFEAYMEGAGVRFLHFSVVILPVIAIILLLDLKIKKWKRILMLIPPFFIPLLWGQRGMSIGFMIGVMFVLTILMKPLRQLFYFSLGAFILLQMIIVVGEIRTNVSTGGVSINDLAGMDSEIPTGAVWAYTYTAPSILNLNQTINNPDVRYLYGFEVVEPILSLTQLKMFSNEIKDDNEVPFQVYDGFNVPTYLYWCYINFGYVGFFVVPFILGLMLQTIFNKITKSSKVSIGLYVLFFPSLVYSFHDFLFWNAGTILVLVSLVYVFYKIKIFKKSN